MAICWCHPSSSPSSSLSSSSSSSSTCPLAFSRPITNPRRRPTTLAFATRIGAVELAPLLQNKVLVSATVASLVGQLAKPLTKALNGEGFDVRAVVRSGGMPSTHSAAVAAASASLGFERGFSDSIFGMSVVFAAIIMYDAQGVRREVGKHARSLNELKEDLQVSSPSLQAKEEEEEDLPRRLENSMESESSISSLSTLENPNSESPLGFTSQKMLTSGRNATVASGDVQQLSESVGHTEIQVVVGALLGFLAAFSVQTIP